MEEVLELGGNIKLIGFKEINPGLLVVVKKMIGNYAKQINEKHGEFQEISLSLKETNPNFKLISNLSIKEKSYDAEITDSNLFFAIDKVLSKIINSLK